MLDVVGFIPGLGDVADGLNAVVSLLRGNYADAGLSVLSMIPFADLFTKLGKYIGRGGGAVEAALDYGGEAFKAGEELLDHSDEIAETGETLSKELEDQIEADWYHPTEPDILGGEAKVGGAGGVVTKPYATSRPKYGPTQVDDVWNAHADSVTNTVQDPSGATIVWERTNPRNGQWDMGHIPGQKHSDIHARYMKGEISLDEFLKWYRNPNNYRPELPGTNRSHFYENSDMLL